MYLHLQLAQWNLMLHENSYNVMVFFTVNDIKKMSAFFPNKFSLLTCHDLMELRFALIMSTCCDISVSTAVIALGRDWGICNMMKWCFIHFSWSKNPRGLCTPSDQGSKVGESSVMHEFYGKQKYRPAGHLCWRQVSSTCFL